MSHRSNILYTLPASENEFATDAVVVTDLYRTDYGHFARITDRQEIAYVSRGHDGHYEHLNGDTWPVHLGADTSSRREIAVASKIAQVSQS